MGAVACCSCCHRRCQSLPFDAARVGPLAAVARSAHRHPRRRHRVVSGPLPGAVHDLTAARLWGILRELAASGLVVLVGKGYLGAGDDLRTPYKGVIKPASQKAANHAHAKLRGPGERANAQLKTGRILCRLRCVTDGPARDQGYVPVCPEVPRHAAGLRVRCRLPGRGHGHRRSRGFMSSCVIDRICDLLPDEQRVSGFAQRIGIKSRGCGAALAARALPAVPACASTCSRIQHAARV
jgi:hypothetical protein